MDDEEDVAKKAVSRYGSCGSGGYDNDDDALTTRLNNFDER